MLLSPMWRDFIAARLLKDNMVEPNTDDLDSRTAGSWMPAELLPLVLQQTRHRYPHSLQHFTKMELTAQTALVCRI